MTLFATYMSDNCLTEDQVLKLSGKQNYAEVQKLNAFAVGISKVCPLEKFVNLEIISLSLNSISNLKGFVVCEKLKELYLRKNNISNLLQIGHLKDLRNLKVLFLADNPCCAEENYRTKTVRVLKCGVRL